LVITNPPSSAVSLR